MRRRTIATVVACLAVLALPGAAVAQSAGDEQYVDPFGETEQPPAQERAQQGGGSDGSSGQGQSAPAVEAQPETQPSQAAPAPQAGGTLPRTGLAIVPIAVAGYALLLGGFALRRRA